jgi:hypothetical protein
MIKAGPEGFEPSISALEGIRVHLFRVELNALSILGHGPPDSESRLKKTVSYDWF